MLGTLPPLRDGPHGCGRSGRSSVGHLREDARVAYTDTDTPRLAVLIDSDNTTARLTEELRKAAIVIDIQKKVATLLGRPIVTVDPEEKP